MSDKKPATTLLKLIPLSIFAQCPALLIIKNLLLDSS